MSNRAPTTYSVDLNPGVSKQISSLPQEMVRKILARIDLLRNDPYPRGLKKISALKSVYRIRQGQDRILYRVDLDSRRITVLSVAHRSDAYKGI